jgi:uncharacterized protein YbgA (DUF1722 family)/uncharacterized protein YbbK (DUF523 family)
MNSFPKPVVVASKCLGFAACRYNGQTLHDPFVERLKPFVEFSPVCPEVEIGLGVPRAPIRVVNDKGRLCLFQPAADRNVTGEMEAFVGRCLDSVSETDGFVLKNRSPSCGFTDVKVYEGFGKDAGSKRGSGFFGGEVLRRFPFAPVEDEGRLKNFTIREHFLTSLFALARFREVAREGSPKALVGFHTVNKYLLMGYNQARMREMGTIVANHGKRPLKEVTQDYGNALAQALKKPPRFTAMINVLLHAFGGFKDSLSPDEKRYFLGTVEEYRDERIPLSALLRLIEAWAVGKGNPYLLEQTFMRPYPRELVEVADSGKGRDW